MMSLCDSFPVPQCCGTVLRHAARILWLASHYLLHCAGLGQGGGVQAMPDGHLQGQLKTFELHFLSE